MSTKEQEVKPVAIAEVGDETGQEQAVQEHEAGALAQRNPMEIGAVTGEVGMTDIRLPTLRIIQKMSDNPDKLDDGTITLDNQTVIQNAKGEVRLTVLAIHKHFREVLPYGAGIPQVFDSAEEAIESGFRIARSKADRDSGVPVVEDAARAIIAVEQPEGAMDRAYPIVIDKLRLVPALWYIQSTAYREVAKYIFSQMHFQLRETGLLPAVWLLRAEQIKGAKGIYYVPRIKLLGEVRSQEFVDKLVSEVQL